MYLLKGHCLLCATYISLDI
uniref:Uncharacterized protein n=1 Tax=Anguilla anguilla TaxID=7936 RepID=A0A0E9THR1_ANGAN